VSDRPVVIVNPRSGGGISDKQWAQMVAPLTDGLGPFDVRRTERAGDGRRLALDEAAAGRGLIVALGGDGTISEVADGIIASGLRAELGVVNRGTGGDLRRTLGLPKDLAEGARRVRETPARTIDVGRATCVGADGAPVTRHFINVASFGLSAAVAGRANASNKRLGPQVAFLGALVRTLVTYDNVDVTLAIDGGEPSRHRLLLGAIGNARFFGGGMKICPEAELTDGLFDVVTVGDLGKLAVMLKTNRLYDGSHLSMKEVASTRARRVEIRPVEASETRIHVEMDGESPGFLPATFEMVPAALRLRF
jgi:YegS/Rv2252/BmrU family lipid kinase